MQNLDKNDYLEALISSITDSYIEQPSFLPNKGIVIEITELLRKLIFPGYFDKEDTDYMYLRYYVGSLLIEVRGKLQKQICRALLHETATICSDDAEALSEKITVDFLKKIPELREILLTDVDATLDGDPAARNKHEIIFAYPGIFAIGTYRIAHELHLLGVPLIPRIMTEYAHSVTGIDIHPGARIGHHFFIDHGTGVVIGETTEIGNFVKIYQGVTLGAISTRGGQSLYGKKRHPTLEDEVTVYSSTSILGGETIIGRGTVIGSNAFLTKSVSSDVRVSIKSPELSFKDLKQREQDETSG
ncbi:MAG: serine acetyltransferase [Clostridiales bacterium]|nr:serine acetyltransferase [Clostridiales bacterium]